MPSSSAIPRDQPLRRKRRTQRGNDDALGRFLVVLMHLPAYSRLGWGLIRDPRVSSGQKATLLAGVGYLALPVDLVPGIIPVAGQLDDLAAIILAIRAVTLSLPDEVAAEHLKRAGLTKSTLDRDLRSLGLTALWLVRRGGGLAVRAVRFVAGGALRGLGAILNGIVQGPAKKQGLKKPSPYARRAASESPSKPA
ncbi:MAG: YkvA family protein [Chloroflexota bacterium]